MILAALASVRKFVYVDPSCDTSYCPVVVLNLITPVSADGLCAVVPFGTVNEVVPSNMYCPVPELSKVMSAFDGALKVEPVKVMSPVDAVLKFCKPNVPVYLAPQT